MATSFSGTMPRREIRKDNFCRFTNSGHQWIMVNFKPTKIAIRIKTDEGIDEVIYGILNVWEGRQGRETFDTSLRHEYAMPPAGKQHNEYKHHLWLFQV